MALKKSCDRSKNSKKSRTGVIDFTLETACQAADHALFNHTGRKLSDIETIVFKGAWERLSYEQIAAQNGYAPSYISQDIAPRLWRNLSAAMREEVRKSNFRQSLERYWYDHLCPSRKLPAKRKTAVLDPCEYYVERADIESQCYEALLAPGALVRLKAPSLTGKTYLMHRVLSSIERDRGFRTVRVELRLAPQSYLSNLDRFLHWFCFTITRNLKLENKLAEYWDIENIGAMSSCTEYLEEHVIPAQESPLVLCLDDVHRLFPYPQIYEDFFSLLRTWYEKARTRPRWQPLRLVIIHATDVYIRLNINRSPFNVGVPIELQEFDEKQVRQFAFRFGLKTQSAQFDVEIGKLMKMVGGHPYLLEQAFVYLKTHPHITLSELIEAMPTEAGIYGNHLRKHLQDLHYHRQLAIAYRKVVLSPTPVRLEPMSAYQLQSTGLVNIRSNEAIPRCQLYRLYFGEHLHELESD